MSYSRVVLTCGVSLFSANNTPGNWIREQNFLVIPPGGVPNPRPLEGETEEQALRAIQNHLHNLPVPGEPTRFSAEYSALHALRTARLLADRPQVVLVHTHTLGGKATAKILTKALTRDFDATCEAVLVHLNVDDRNELRKDLGRFLHQIANALRGHDSSTTCFAPLGGYKVMTSMAYLAGAYMGFSAFYAHEDNQTLHEIPGVPIRIPPDELRQAKPALVAAKRECDRSSLTAPQLSIVEQYPWLFEETDEFVVVNAFGRFLMEENPDLFCPKLFVAEGVDRTPEIEKKLRAVAVKLAAGSEDTELFHEGDLGLHGQDGWHVLKLRRDPLRAIYRFDATANTLAVKWLTLEHGDNNQYVRQCKAAWPTPAGNLVEWSLA